MTGGPRRAADDHRVDVSDREPSSRPPDQADVRTRSVSGDGPGHESSWSSSWSTEVDAEIQRDLIASRVFDGGPFTIDRFEIEKLLGAGSSGAVYAARDPLLDRRVAIKVLARVRAQQANVAGERWIREARALAHLSHRNVVAIYDVGQWKGRPFIAMELVDGTTLALWLAAKRRSVAEIAHVFREAGCGLAAAHARGHVHRDFKPANVLVAHDGRVLVSDFGLVDDAAQDQPIAGCSGTGSQVGEARAGSRYPVGTPAYAAPEQRAGARPRPSADVYSFAVSLVEALLGYHPTAEPTAAWQPALRSRVSRRLFRELRAAMAADPGQRAQSLAPVLEALAPRRSARRWRATAALATGGMAVLVAVGLVGRTQRPAWNDTQEAAPRLSPSVLPAEIDKEVQSLLATAPERRGPSWDQRARTVLMLPIPTRVPCRWGASPRLANILGDQVVALDSHDHLAACAIRSGMMTAMADEVLCYRLVDDMTLRVVFRNRNVAVYQHRDASWQAMPVAEPRAIETAALDRYCRDPSLRDPFLRDSAKYRDVEVHTAGDRKLSRKADGSLWLQAGDGPAKLLAEYAIAHQADSGLRHAIVATSTRVRVFDLVTMSMIADAPNPAAEVSSAISRDGSVAVLASSGHLMWWRRGEPQWQSRPVDTPPGRVMLSPRADRVLSVAPDILAVHELGSGRRYTLAGGQIQEARFLDDDQVVAVDFSGGVWWWSLARLRSWVLADHAGQTWMWGAAMCKRAGSVVTATNRKDRAILISSPGGAPQQELTKPPDAQIYGISCEGDRIVAGTLDGRVLEWDRPAGRLLSEHDTGARAWLWTIASASPAPGSRIDLIGTGSTREQRIGGRVMMVRDGVVSEVFAARFNGGLHGINEIAVSSNGRRAAAVASSGELIVIDVVGATSKATTRHRGTSRRVRFADDDRIVVSAGDDGYLLTWRVDDLSLQGEINVGHGKIYDLDVHGTMAVVATSDGYVGAWDLSTHRLVRTYRVNGAQAATARFDVSGQWIVSGDYEGSACLHRVDQEGCYVTLIGHKAAPAVRHGLFLDDGQIITASDDGTVRQWLPPYRASRSDLACELQQYRFDPGSKSSSVTQVATSQNRQQRSFECSQSTRSDPP